MTQDYHQEAPNGEKHNENKWKRKRIIVVGVILAILFMILIVILILALTIFKINDPKIQVLSVAVDGVNPHVSFPIIQLQLNLTFDLKIQVENPNHASFRHGAGKSLFIYRGSQVGEVNLDPGFIQARGSTIIPCLMALTMDVLSSNTQQLINDMQAGNILIETTTSIPGTASFLGGLIKKHIVATSQCQMTFGFPDMKIVSKDCKSHNKT